MKRACVRRARVGTALLVAILGAAPAAADTFRMRIPGGGPEDWLRVPATNPDADCSGQVTAAEAIAYAEACGSLEPHDEHWLHAASDCGQTRARKVIALVEAIGFISNHPGSFGGNGGVQLFGPCDFPSIPGPGPDPTETVCNGIATFASLLMPQIAGVPFAPGGPPPSNVPADLVGPSVPVPVVPLAPVQVLAVTPTTPVSPPGDPCQIDLLPQTPILPGGDGPLFCAATVTQNGGPCSVAPSQPNPTMPDVPVCFGDTQTCTPMDPLDPQDPTDPPDGYVVPPWSICNASTLVGQSSGTCGAPGRQELPFDEEPSDGIKPEVICNGLCKVEPNTPEEVVQPDVPTWRPSVEIAAMSWPRLWQWRSGTPIAP